MNMDLTGINNYNEYYTNHYLASIFPQDAEKTINEWRNRAKETETRTPWALLRECSRQYYSIHDRYLRSRGNGQTFPLVRDLAEQYLTALGYPTAAPLTVEVDEGLSAPVYLELKKPNGAPLLWVMLAHTVDRDDDLLKGFCFQAADLENDNGRNNVMTTEISNEELTTKILFAMTEPPRWILFAGLTQIVLIDRNKWNEKRYLQFVLEDIFGRREDSTFQAMAVLLHKESLCPEDGNSLLDQLDENSRRHSSGVSEDLKYALREAIELLGNEVLYDLVHRQGRDLEAEPVDAEQLTIECLRYMYRMLFVLFIEARPELGYAPMKDQVYVQGYSLESLRDIAERVRDEISIVGEGYYLHETLSKLFNLIYNGYPEKEETLKELASQESRHDVFVIEPLKAHIFDPEYTTVPGYEPLIPKAKLRNKVMLRIIDLLSVTRPSGHRNEHRGRISYSNLGINQLGAVYEALLSYRGFIAEETLYEVKRAGDKFDELDVGYFVPERELDNYTEEERIRYESGENKGKLRKYEKGTFIYRLAGREKEKSASYYTPEALTKCLVKYALKELLEGKNADEILQLTICEPAMGSAAFLNEAINQLAEAYLERKQKELGEVISYEKRAEELQRVKMYIADRNVYGIDLNPIAVELAEVSLWLNTICKGGFVPWFGTQLVCGNSLIGARRQCYRVEQLKANRAPGRWYDNAPERIMPGERRMPKKQVYHFLLGDPGMSNYTDQVIKDLVSEQIQAIKKWNREFIRPYEDEDIQTLLRLSAVIDDLWEKQVELRKAVRQQTTDPLPIYGHEDDTKASRTTIREKDLIYRRLYKSEEMENAGPYARLKFAMDYWCALWFWPIDKTDLLPSRSDFLFDMALILEGGVQSVTKEDLKQGKLFPTQMQEMADQIYDLYKDLPEVDLAALCERNPRLKLVKEIADKNKFFHWELEFADLFAERGGFDLIIGNPPWIKLEWNEQAVLSDRQPLFAVKNFTATQTTQKRKEALSDPETYRLYLAEYVSIAGMQNFLNAVQNYPILKGQQTNLYKCFLPQAWTFCREAGISAFVHPDGVYDDPKGGLLRGEIYPRLRRHFQFINELKLFPEVDHHMVFSLNVYCNAPGVGFDMIANLFAVTTIEECYDRSIQGSVPGIKDESSKWNIKGHPDRVLRVGRKELSLFAKLFDGSDNWKEARLPALHAQQLLAVLSCFEGQEKTVGSLREKVFSTVMWDETNAQKKIKAIEKKEHFPQSLLDMIYSGPHIGVANPLFKASRSICEKNSDYDSIDLIAVPKDYLQRCKYSPAGSIDKYLRRIPTAPWGEKYHANYRVLVRKMLNLSGERTLIPAIAPPYTGHIHGIFGLGFKDIKLLAYSAGIWASIPFDFFVKIMGKDNIQYDIISKFPLLSEFQGYLSILCRSLLLNSVNKCYSPLWKELYQTEMNNERWSKSDPRLRPERFTSLTPEWTWDTPLRTDYERRQALVEIDVLTAMALGMTLDQLKTIYRIQFPVLQQYEADTWYDQNGRIVFTTNRSLTNVGFPRTEWEQVKDAKSGTFTRTIIDDTMPGGPVERTIKYVAPFDRCDREEDYETAWAFFEKRFREQ